LVDVIEDGMAYAVPLLGHVVGSLQGGIPQLRHPKFICKHPKLDEALVLGNEYVVIIFPIFA
jgi:hypothetical protein